MITGREPGPAAPAPAWLRELADAAATMEVHPQLTPPASGGRESAVLILFGDGPDGPDLLFIQRSEGLRLHAGQSAFPGGAIDAGDGGPVAAALREAVEEVGLDPGGVDVVGTLPEVFIPRTGFRVVPVLAWWRQPSATHERRTRYCHAVRSRRLPPPWATWPVALSWSAICAGSSRRFPPAARFSLRSWLVVLPSNANASTSACRFVVRRVSKLSCGLRISF